MRKDIYNLFSNYSQSFKLTWGRIFASPRKAIVGELNNLAHTHKCTQRVEPKFIFWQNDRGETEAMFSILPDIKTPRAIGEIYQRIQKEKPPVTYVFVDQSGDGPGNYDIFRLSETSYLEHNNRARYRSKTKRFAT